MDLLLFSGQRRSSVCWHGGVNLDSHNHPFSLMGHSQASGSHCHPLITDTLLGNVFLQLAVCFPFLQALFSIASLIVSQLRMHLDKGMLGKAEYSSSQYLA